MATITTKKMVSPAGHRWWRQVLLGCGMVAPAWWVAMDVVGSLRYPGYNYLNQTISELSAEGAPTRVFMMVLSGIPYAVLTMGLLQAQAPVAPRQPAMPPVTPQPLAWYVAEAKPALDQHLRIGQKGGRS